MATESRSPWPNVAALAPPTTTARAVSIANAVKASRDETSLFLFCGRERSKTRVDWLSCGTHGDFQIRRVHRRRSEEREAADFRRTTVARPPFGNISAGCEAIFSPHCPTLRSSAARCTTTQAMGCYAIVRYASGRWVARSLQRFDADGTPCGGVEMSRSGAQNGVERDHSVAVNQGGRPLRAGAPWELFTPASIPSLRLVN